LVVEVVEVAEVVPALPGAEDAELGDDELELPQAVAASRRTLRTAIRVTRYLTAADATGICAHRQGVPAGLSECG
jgi:hypothetical protein